jgi:uncharacterized membrane protein YbhN (UPF0104 family)
VKRWGRWGRGGRWRWLIWVLALACAAWALRVLTRFPWSDAWATLVGVNLWLLCAALLVNLLSMVAKGWAWHLLLGRVAPNRWAVAQQANLLGVAVNIVGVGVSGEVARVAFLKRQDGVPVRVGALSVVWARLVEAVGLALSVAVAPWFLALPPAVRGLQLGAALGCATVVLVTRYRGWGGMVRMVPKTIRPATAEFLSMGSGRGAGGLVAPLALALVNWAAQWTAFHLMFRASHLPVSAAASFTALLAVNLGGVVRFTPANVGVMQAAIAGGLLPFGVPVEQAVAAGLALQAIQVVPVLAFAVAFVGWAGLKRLTTSEQELERAA